MAKEFPLESVDVKPVETKYRKISGKIPNNQTIEQLNRLRQFEARSMRGQLPIIWDHAEGINVFDAYGNKWLDFSSGVLITNSGHGRKEIADAIIEQASKPLLTTYCFANQPRIDLVQKLVDISPKKLNKVFLLSTGAESTECALKLMRTYGRSISDAKNIIVSFMDSFHGRTLGSQQMGALGSGRAWIKNLDPEIVHVPFPDGFRNENISFDLFEETLLKLKINPDNVAGVISETYQGIGPNFMPKEYAQKLRNWCDAHKALLCFDEVQAGFGRCGTWWGFEHYGIDPDLFCMGKGFSSSLPISGVIGRADVMELYGPNEMTSTHSANPICCSAALANIKLIEQEKLVQNAAELGKTLKSELASIQKEFSDVVGFAPAEGLVGGLLMIKKGTKEPDYDLAWNIIYSCFQKGLLLFAPVGLGGGCVKIAPPLCITKDALIEGCGVIRQTIKDLRK
ncbi:MAG: 4-aminobutyrate aminotransferase [Planctomycetes bacterium GWF2_41_51]|nr:MAG: 4-aminobutyrate aminotransferase [Planctomycetes bacterium GWF2_41_51]HBG26664.1 aspartate aminotransferase family protein [Phycisphaerales bacterium]